MHTYRRDIGSRRHSRHGEIIAEVEVRAVSLVDEHEHTVRVSKLSYAAKVGANAVICGIVDHYRLCVGILADSLLDLRNGHTERDSELFVHVGIDVDGDCSSENERIYRAPVDVARHDYLVALLAGVHYHALHRRGGAAHHEEGICRAECLGSQLLRVLDDGYGVTEVVQRLHGVYINIHAVLAEELSEFHITSAPLMSGDVKGNDSHAAEFPQRLIYRRICLGKVSHFRTRSFR